jgi:hypothetical protein
MNKQERKRKEKQERQELKLSYLSSLVALKTAQKRARQEEELSLYSSRSLSKLSSKEKSSLLSASAALINLRGGENGGSTVMQPSDDAQSDRESGN